MKLDESNDIQMLRGQVEILMRDRDALLDIAHAAANFVDKVNLRKLPISAIDSATQLAKSINQLPESTLTEALERRPI